MDIGIGVQLGQPLSGGAPKQLTDYSDVVLITDFKQQ
jgi:hypothetical protein